MENLMFCGMILISSLVIGMSIYILIAQAWFNNELQKKYNELKRELRRAFGWEEYKWADNFDGYARKIEKLIEFKKGIERLEIIQKALDAQKLEDLQKKKEHIESVIKTLEK